MKHEPRLSGDDIEYASESLTCRINAFAEEIRKDLRAAALMADAAMQQARRPDAQISDVTDAAIAIRASAIASDRGLSEIRKRSAEGSCPPDRRTRRWRRGRNDDRLHRLHGAGAVMNDAQIPMTNAAIYAQIEARGRRSRPYVMCCARACRRRHHQVILSRSLYARP